MANVGEVTVQLRARVDQLERDLQRAQNTMRSWASSTRTIIAGITGVTVGGAIAIAVKEAAQQQEAIKRLESALRTAGRYTPQYVDSLKNLAGEFQKVTRFTDDAVNSVQTTLTVFGASEKNIKGLTQAALDLAAGLGIDLGTAALFVGKAMQGNVVMLQRYGIQVAKTSDEGKRFAEIQRGIAGRFGGRALADAQTFTGRLVQLKNAFGEVAESAGSIIVQSASINRFLSTTATGILDLAEKVGVWADAHQELIDTRIEDFFANLPSHVDAAGTAFDKTATSIGSTYSKLASIATFLDEHPNVAMLLGGAVAGSIATRSPAGLAYGAAATAGVLTGQVVSTPTFYDPQLERARIRTSRQRTGWFDVLGFDTNAEIARLREANRLANRETALYGPAPLTLASGASSAAALSLLPGQSIGLNAIAGAGPSGTPSANTIIDKAAIKEAAKAAADAEKQALDERQAREELIRNTVERRIGLLDIEAQRSELSARAAAERLSYAQQDEATSGRLLELARAADDAERATLATSIRITDQKIAQLEALRGVGAATAETELEIEQLRLSQAEFNLELERGPQHVREIERSFFSLRGAIAATLGDFIRGIGQGTTALKALPNTLLQGIQGRAIESLANRATSALGSTGILRSLFGGTGAAGGAVGAGNMAAELGTAPAFESALMGGSGAAGAGGLLAGMGPALAIGAGLTYVQFARKDPFSLSKKFGGGALGGAAAGAAYGSIVPGLGTSIGAAIGAIVGALENKSTSGTIQGRAIFDAFKQLNLPRTRFGGAFNKLGWTGGAGAPAGLAGAGGIAGMLFQAAGGPNAGGTLPRNVTGALLGTASDLGLSTESTLNLIRKFSRGMASSFDEAITKLITLRATAQGSISDQALLGATAELLDVWNDLPDAIDRGRLALELFTKDGSISLEQLQRATDDVSSFFTTAFPEAIKNAVTTGKLTQVGNDLGQAFSDAFISRLSERLLQQPGMGGALTEAVALATQGADLLAAGDISGGTALLDQARVKYRQGVTDFGAILGRVVGPAHGFASSVGGSGSSGGFVNQTGWGEAMAPIISDVRSALGGGGRVEVTIRNNLQVELDGATIARSVDNAQNLQRVGVQMPRQVSFKR